MTLSIAYPNNRITQSRYNVLPILCKRANVHSTEVSGATADSCAPLGTGRPHLNGRQTPNVRPPWNPCFLSVTTVSLESPSKRRALSFAINGYLGGDCLPAPAKGWSSS